ncbi:3'-5' exonuclease [Aerococcaceae bacterium zg-B36]|uniref:3'-5' exonuclease n=1 Tax=Aerococcaceae bacterium zg-252 TaxID=2796928 RepID=UPI001BD8A67D|nr:3'-5' exonuclease [Aerococcaceae bacterium zg-B36]
MNKNFSKIVVLDLETTGLKPVTSEITEVGAVVLDLKLNPINEYSTLVKIQGDIPAKVTELTGITKEMCEKDGKDFETVKREVQELVKDAVIIAHNAAFDLSFLKHHFDIDPEYFYDTLTISRSIDFQQRTHKLGDICERKGISLKNAHRSLNDVLATVEVFKHFVKNHKGTTVQYLNVLSGKRLSYRPTHTQVVL